MTLLGSAALLKVISLQNTSLCWHTSRLLTLKSHRRSSTCVRRSTPAGCRASSSGGEPHWQMAGMVGAVVWYRKDLRITDHEPLLTASSTADTVLPLYCLDVAELQPRRGQEEGGAGVPKLGPYRCRFLLEAAANLRSNLELLHSTLQFRLGQPALEVAAAVQAVAGDCREVHLHHYKEAGPDSARVEDEVAAAFHAMLKSAGLRGNVHTYWGATLYHPDDLPDAMCLEEREADSGESVPVGRDSQRFQMFPSIMTDFRKAVEHSCRVREPLPAPTHMPPPPPGIDPGEIPCSVQHVYESTGALRELRELEQLVGHSMEDVPAACSGEFHAHTAMPFAGGETEGLQRLQYYLSGSTVTGAEGPNSQPAPIHSFKDTRMTAVGVDNSAKLSAYIAAGCLSQRTIYDRLQGTDSEGSSWLKMHLIIRDFFTFTAIKEGSSLLDAEGIKQQPVTWDGSCDQFQRWCQGRMGLPFVDACMHEIASTGYMSNRGRQNVANLLTQGLHVDWRLGAEVFESLLVDHDFAVNFANWAYNAGVGNDPRRHRHFCTVSQGLKYDPDAELIKAWVPELRAMPVDLAHQPWNANNDDVQVVYVSPILDVASQLYQQPMKT